jgi:hypothetical protein
VFLSIGKVAPTAGKPNFFWDSRPFEEFTKYSLQTAAIKAIINVKKRLPGKARRDELM